MTTVNTFAQTPQPGSPLEFPDPPEREPDDMTNFNQTNVTGNTHHLVHHLGNIETTLVAGEHYISRVPTTDMTGLRYPDLLIAFNVDPAAYYRSNAYIISEQGKPPDFVLEIASRRTGRTDVVEKRNDYAALRILEYWRFDETGQFHGTRLAGDRLVNGRYEPIDIEQTEEGALQGYSAALNLYLRWDGGQLAWHDPATGRHILTYEGQRERADSEREGRLRAEARVRELEEQLHHHDS